MVQENQVAMPPVVRPGAASATRERAQTPKRRRKEPFEYPQAALAAGALQTLMASGKDALFRQRLSDTIYEEKPYRATAFWPEEDAASKETLLYPFLRCNYGGNVHVCPVSLSFRKGNRFAGEAWQELDNPVMAENIRPLDDFTIPPPINSEDDSLLKREASWRRHWQTEHNVPEVIAQNMGMGTGYIKQVRAVLCLGMNTSYGDIVFCIESSRRNAFADENFTKRANRFIEARLGDEDDHLTPKVVVLLQHILSAKVAGHVDFWTWLRARNMTWRGLVVLCTTLVNGLNALPFAPILAQLKKLEWQFQARIAAFVISLLPVIFLAGLELIPTEGSRVTINTEVETRLRMLKKYWSRALFCWGTAIFLATMPFVVATVKFAPSRPLLIASSLAFEIASSYFIFATYLCVGRFSPGIKLASSSQERDAVTHAPRLALIGFVLLGLVALLLVSLRSPGSTASLVGAYGVAGIIGLPTIMLAGRIDSRLIGAPGSMIAMLYLNGVFRLFDCITNIYIDHNDGHRAIAVALHMVRLFLDVGFYIVVVWAFTGRALERYLTYVADLAASVPRRSYVASRRDP